VGLTLFAIPFLVLGLFLNPHDQGTQRCIGVKAGGPESVCFGPGSQMPEIIKYGAALIGFGLIYAGRRQLQRRRMGK
jgi:hypothetical protein